MDPRPRLLVTGAGGFLGHNVCAAAVEHYEVFGTVLRRASTLRELRTVQTDITDFAALKDCLDAVKPHGVIHTAAAADPAYCQQHPQESWRINVQAAANLAGLCADRHIALIFTSTDLVFDGLHAPYKETDPVSPVNIYGEHKALAEQNILERHPTAAVCRLPLMFGMRGSELASFLAPLLRLMHEGKQVVLFTDEYRTPVSGATAARGLLLALHNQVRGILHLGGKESISRYDFGTMVARVFAFTGATLLAARQQDVPCAAPRPRDVSLDSSLAYKLGYAPPPLIEELETLARQLRHAYSLASQVTDSK